MATAVIMPRQGQSVESCIIVKWYKAKGDKVQTGDLLFCYETDKASFDEEVRLSGTLLDVFFEEGDDVPVLTNVCVIGEEGENASQFNPNAATTADEAAAAGSGADNVIGTNTAAGTGTNTAAGTGINAAAGWDETAQGMLKISPRARNAAEKSGVDYRFATPTGPDGRIIENDIIKLKESGFTATPAAMAEMLKNSPAGQVEGTGIGGRITALDLARAGAAGSGIADAGAAGAGVTGAENAAAGAAGAQAGLSAVAQDGLPYEEVKLTNIRKVIAKAMFHSISTTCQLTYTSTFDATEIMAFRKKLKEGKEYIGLENITLNDIILFAVSRTLPGHKNLNANFTDDRMLLFRNVNLGMAVDTDRGLMVPTIFNANLKSLNDIAREAKALAASCQSGSINPDLLRGGSFTVSNLGSLGIESFTPVLNPPQTGILGVDCIVQRARENDGEIEYYPAMGLSLTADHRVIDGAPAARFLQDLKRNLENFSALLAK